MQLMTTLVDGLGTRSLKQRNASPAGAAMLPGMLPRAYSACGRESRTTTSSFAANARFSAAGVMDWGRPASRANRDGGSDRWLLHMNDKQRVVVDDKAAT
tara:strand:- start:346 stop:645 length:300 start_codon:yes stop_codon:yes gene_type:complete